jgi:hypothetical protein
VIPQLPIFIIRFNVPEVCHIHGPRGVSEVVADRNECVSPPLLLLVVLVVAAAAVVVAATNRFSVVFEGPYMLVKFPLDLGPYLKVMFGNDPIVDVL